MKKIIMQLLIVISCTISPVFAAPQESIEEKTLDTYVIEAIAEVINVANSEIGYIEKKSNNSLYSKEENIGVNNYTKYANDLNTLNFYKSNMQGQPWCDIFIDWCFTTAFGAIDAKNITYQNLHGSAACAFSMKFFQTANQFYQTPQPGDQIFFTKGSGSNHTGLVYKVDNNTVYTIEGNTNSDSGVVANGGAVKAKSYNLNSNKIAGYGRPNYNQIAQKRKIEDDTLIQKEKMRKMRTQLFNKNFIN